MSTTTRARSTSTGGPSLQQVIALVAGREITMRLRSKSFLISTAILLLGVLASVVIGGFQSQQGADRIPVAVVGSAETAVAASDALEPRSAGT